MSNFTDVRELLQHNRQLHDRTAGFYTQLARQVVSERVKMFLCTLVKHEVELAKELESYLEQAPDSVLNTYFQFDHEQDIEHLYQTPIDFRACNEQEIAAIASRIDSYLCELYQEMAEEVDNERVRALFVNLHEHMEQEKKRLSTDLYSMWDM